MNRSQGQPLRNVTNVPQQQNQSRTGAPSSRIVASKSNAWGTVGSAGTPPNHSVAQTESWAQAMNSRNTQLDLTSSSSFPSLAGGNAQSQNSNSGSSPWQTGPPAQEQSQRQAQGTNRVLQSRQQQLSSSRDGPFSNDGFSRGGSSAMDEFSRLDQSGAGRNSTASHDRLPPGLVLRQPNPLSESISNDPSRVTTPAGPPPGLSARSPISSGVNGSIGQERPNDRSQQSPTLAQPQLLSKESFTTPLDRVTTENGITDPTQQSTDSIIRGMSERDRWGLPGWQALHDGPSADMRALSRGQDLSSLGLNAEPGTSLLRSYPGPFAPPGAFPPRPLDTDYTIPECYIVQNVAPIQQRISGFTEDTLFYIFYTSPKDIIQEEVATELMSRKWRFHMKEKMWLTRDDTTAVPVILEKEVCEQGYYIWWDWRNWKRARRAYTLRYEDLDDHLSGGVGRLAGGVGTTAQQQQQQQQQLGMNGGGTGAGAPGGAGAGNVQATNAAAASFNAVPGLERMAALGRGF